MLVLWLPPGLKTGMDFRGQVWIRVWKITFFWSEIWGSGFGEQGGTAPLRIPRSNPPRFFIWLSAIKRTVGSSASYTRFQNNHFQTKTFSFIRKVMNFFYFLLSIQVKSVWTKFQIIKIIFSSKAGSIISNLHQRQHIIHLRTSG